MRHSRTYQARCGRGLRRLRPFTLIELLVVLVIVGILLAVTVPVFEKITIGSGVDAAGRMVGAQLRLARQYAISNRKRIAVLMPADQLEDTQKFTAFRSCEVDESNQWVRWVPNTKWEYLPTGAVVRSINQTSGSTGAAAADSAQAVSNVDGSGNSCRAVVFRSTGRLVGTQQYVHLVEGAYTSGSAPQIRNADNRITIHVDTYTGRVTYDSN